VVKEGKVGRGVGIQTDVVAPESLGIIALLYEPNHGCIKNAKVAPQVTPPLLAAGVQISMDGKGRAYDNIFTERLWRSVKYEEVYLADYGTPREARQGIARYLTFYTTERPHQALNYRRPAERYHGAEQ
jgi:transposase InsO family protein